MGEVVTAGQSKSEDRPGRSIVVAMPDRSQDGEGMIGSRKVKRRMR